MIHWWLTALGTTSWIPAAQSTDARFLQVHWTISLSGSQYWLYFGYYFGYYFDTSLWLNFTTLHSILELMLHKGCTALLQPTCEHLGATLHLHIDTYMYAAAPQPTSQWLRSAFPTWIGYWRIRVHWMETQGRNPLSETTTIQINIHYYSTQDHYTLYTGKSIIGHGLYTMLDKCYTNVYHFNSIKGDFI